MSKARTARQSYEKNATFSSLDDRDRQIVGLLLAGKSNRAIAQRLKIPMSTVQRRTRKLFEQEIVWNRVHLNYKKLGLRTGLLHVYLKNGNIDEVGKRVSLIRGIRSTTIHIGNSDIVGQFVFKASEELVNIMAETKKIDGVDRVVWSEEVMDLPDDGNDLRIFENL